MNAGMQGSRTAVSFLLCTPVRRDAASGIGSKRPAGRGRPGRTSISTSGEVAVTQLCDDLRQFAIEVRKLGYSVDGGVAERECLDLSERMLAAVRRSEARGEPARS